MKKILIGIDDSKFADYAAEYGFKIAKKVNAQIGLVHIVEPIITTPVAGADSTIGIPFEATTDALIPELYEIQDEHARKILAAVIKKYGEGLQISTFTQYGDTADGIINCSKDFNADIIVIGTHSRTGIDRFLMGSVAEHVVRHSEIPVLVVPMHNTEA